MFLGSKVRLLRGADNLTAIYEPIVDGGKVVGLIITIQDIFHPVFYLKLH
jgi:hypothetical protein